MSTTQAERNLALAVLVRAGDHEARKTLIVENQRLVTTLVDSYTAAHPQHKHLQEDAVSEGYVALTKAADRIAAGVEVENVTAFLAKWIKRAIAATADANSGVAIKPRTARKHRKKEKTVLKSHAFADGIGSDVTSQTNHEAVTDLREAIYSAATNEVEQRLLELFEEGSKPNEIAKALGKSIGWVYATRKKLLSRFYDRNPEFAPRNQ